MKKTLILCIALVCFCCLLVFAGGSAEPKSKPASSPSSLSEPVTIQLLHTYGEGSKKAARDDWFVKFAEKFPNIKLEATRYSLDQANQKLLAAVAAGTPPDAVSNHYYYFTRYANEGLLEPLDPYFAKDGIDPKSTFFPSALEISTFNGTLYTVPQFIYSRALLYNKDLFKQAGLDPNEPPKTLEELVAYAQKITRWDGSSLDTAGFQFPRPDEKEHMVNFFIMLVWGQGGDIFNADRSKVTFDSPAGIRALQFYADLANKYKVSNLTFGAGAQSAQKPFGRGKAGMIVAGNFDLVFMRETSKDINFGAALLPPFAGGKPASLVDGFGLAMLKTSKHKDAVWQLLKFTAGEPAQRSFAVLSSNFPALRSAANDPYFDNDPEMQVFKKSMDVGRAIPPVHDWTEIQDILANAISSALNGSTAPDVALKTAALKVNTEVLR